MEVLEHSPDMFGGIIVDAEKLPDDPEEFGDRLRLSMDAWRTDGRRLVWVDVPIQRSALIPVATKAGFVFHHANEEDVMLVCRLVEGAFVPTHATHYIGVGGVVINDREELLVVCERHRRTAAPYYKLPGGALQPGEHLVEAVLREVREETGVNAQFESLVCFRHWHGYRYGKSDIYFVCRLRPLSQDLTMQVEEIEELMWMPVADYFASDLVSAFNKRIVHAALNSPGVVPEWIDGYADPARYEFFMPHGERA
jgi:8-oxo-dGTP pyrophosphatase MutT (NUDIX family)